MASTINAAVGGIVNTADASGELALQASGTTIATLTTSGGNQASVSGNLNLSGTSRRITGDFSNATPVNRPMFQSSTTDGYTVVRAIPNGTSQYAEMGLGNNSDQTAATSTFFMSLSATEARISSSQANTGTLLPLTFQVGGSERARITTTGNLLVGTTTDLSGVTGAISDVNGNVRAIPQSGAAKTTSYTLATGDVGEFINVGSGGSIVVPDAVFATGDVVSVFNNTSGNITITCSITTAYIGGTDADKATITLATRGIATILFISGTVCVVNGNVS
jgi:hypothetical protein